MIASQRAAFNEAWTETAYGRLLTRLQRHAGPIDFPVAETPCFFPASLIDDMVAAGEALVLASLEGAAAEAAEHVVPERFRGARHERHPTCVQVDFGLVAGADGRVRPVLVELQAFPSLYAFQLVLANAYKETYHLDGAVFTGDLDEAGYKRLLADAIVGPHDPADVVLIDIDPAGQKTRPDFTMTEAMLGVRAIDARAVRARAGALWYEHDGQWRRIRRIYNRVVPDEIVRAGIALDFDWREDGDVEWVGHPEWFFRLSKVAIPYLQQHPVVPRTWRLSDITELPAPPDALVLKPLFSFAGTGIVFSPSREQVDAIPPGDRDKYLLQERVAFTPVIETPEGPTQAEIRIMYLWTDRLRATLPLVRMGRGMMMGVAHNRGRRWVGASAALGHR